MPMKNSFRQIKRVLSLVRSFWPHITGLFLVSLLATPIALLKPYALMLVIDSGFGHEPVPGFVRMFFPAGFVFDSTRIALIAALLVLIITLIEYAQVYINWVMGTWVGEKLVLNFRALVFNHIQRLSLVYHDTRGTSDSLYRIQWDTMSVRGLLLTQAPALVSSLVMLVAMVLILFWINVNFALITLCMIPPLVWLTLRSTKLLRKDWYKVKDAESNAIRVVHEVLGSMRVVKSFGQESNESKRFSDSADEAVKGHVKMARIGATYSFWVGLVLAAGTALFILLGVSYVQKGKMTLGELTLTMAYLAQVFTPLQNIIKQLNEIQSSLAGIDRVFSVLDQEKEVQESEHAIPVHEVRSAFQFEHIGFSYDSQHSILKDISFSVKPGDRVGIMGSTGAGKSTLFNLLNRFYDPSEGRIILNGKDIREYKLGDYRNLFSIVLQDAVLFSTTIAENIRYGKPGATDEEVIAAARAANAHDFIMRNSAGYDTIVGERGMQLSGGERQRISLARAFIKNAPVLILDEPTSALDIKTEEQIMESIEELMKGKTTFLITHRLDTLAGCDLIVHLEKGQILETSREQGTDFIARKKKNILHQP